MFSKLGLQLYTVRDCMKDEKAIDKTFEKLVSLGYTQVQTAGQESVEFFNLTKKHGIEIVGTHTDTNRALNDPDETIRIHEMLGTTNIGIAAMPYEARTNYDELMRFIEKFNNAAAIYGKHGFKLTYHNHALEFVKIKGNKTMMDILYEELDKDNSSFVLDTCWVAYAGADVRYWIEKLAGRLDILHLKDIKSNFIDEGYAWTTPQLCEIGEGHIWWDGVMESAEKAGVKYYVVEQDKLWMDNDPIKSLEVSVNYLKKYMK